MLILPDFQSVSHTSSPPQRAAHEPPLLLAAPKIAGLLGEGPHPNPFPACGRGAKAEVTFTFTDSRLERLTVDQRQKLFDAATTLLEIATRFTLDELNDDALRAAASLFARKLTGEPAKRYQNPAHFRAEQDADLLDWLLKVEKRETEARDRHQADTAGRVPTVAVRHE